MRASRAPHEAREMLPELKAWQAVMDRLGSLAAMK